MGILNILTTHSLLFLSTNIEDKILIKEKFEM